MNHLILTTFLVVVGGSLLGLEDTGMNDRNSSRVYSLPTKETYVQTNTQIIDTWQFLRTGVRTKGKKMTG